MTKGIVLVLLVLVVLTQGMLFWAMGGTIRSSRTETLRSRIVQLEAASDTVIRTITSNANLLAFGGPASKFAWATTMKNRLEAFGHLEITMDAMTMANPNIRSVFLTDFDLVFVGRIDSDAFRIRRALREHLDATQWPQDQRYVAIQDESQPVLLCVTPSVVRADGRQLYVVIQLTLDAGTLISLDQAGELERMVLTDAQGRVLYSNAPLWWDEAGAALQGDAQEDAAQAVTLREIDGDIVAVAALDATTGWRWVCSMPASNTFREMSSFVQLTLMTDAVMLALMLVFIAVLNSGITRPLESIIRFVDSVADKEEPRKLEIYSRNEIGQIARQINRLLESVEAGNREKRDVQRRMYELEIVQKQTELSALHSQINPHFMYNTLDCLRSIAMVREVPEVVDIATYMSGILRYSIRGAVFVRMAQELACIREYIGIMQIRFPDRFQVTIDIAEGLERRYIPRMILQPIVENAFLHGLEPSRGEAILAIRAYQSESQSMWLEIADSGKGMTEAELRALRASMQSAHVQEAQEEGERRSIGLNNIAHRIRLLFGPQYSMYVESALGQGTTVILQLPILEKRPSE